VAAFLLGGLAPPGVRAQAVEAPPAWRVDGALSFMRHFPPDLDEGCREYGASAGMADRRRAALQHEEQLAGLRHRGWNAGIPTKTFRITGVAPGRPEMVELIATDRDWFRFFQYRLGFSVWTR
jgi:hypothetical protein